MRTETAAKFFWSHYFSIYLNCFNSPLGFLMKILLRVLAATSFFVGLVWSLIEPDYSSIAFALSSLVVLAGTFLPTNNEPAQPSQFQKVEEKGIGIQAGRDANVGDINRSSSGKKNAR